MMEIMSDLYYLNLFHFKVEEFIGKKQLISSMTIEKRFTKRFMLN
jgi:hypothetical protein